MGMGLDGVDGSVDLLDFSNARLHLELQIIAIVWLCECVCVRQCVRVYVWKGILGVVCGYAVAL